MTDPQETPMMDVATNPVAELKLDSALLEEARRQTGAASSNEAVNIALRRLVGQERERRLHAYDAVQQMVADGRLDLSAIGAADR